MSQSTYKYKTLQERAAINTASVAGLTIFGVGLSAVFNPVALGVAGGWATYSVAKSLLLTVPTYRNWQFNKMVKGGHAVLLPEDATICKMAKEISDDLGRKEAPKVYTVDTAVVASIALPAGLRWLAKLAPVRNLLEEKAMPKVFAAMPGANTLLTTNQALNNGMTQDELKFIVAHEMAHLKSDAGSLNIYSNAFIKKMSTPLLLATTAAIALSVFGIGLPITAGMGALKALGVFVATKAAADVAIRYGTRIIERRADRNALFVTRDLDNAVGAMQVLHEKEQMKPYSNLKEAFQTHPSYIRRISALREAFEKVSKYPTLKPVNDNQVRAEKENTPTVSRAVRSSLSRNL